jgi:CRISPR-associated exonuclease Cas4
MTYTEDDLLPLSALQRLLFCRRQCALIHIEQAWVENLYTAEGRIMHERVDAGGQAARGDVRVENSVPLRSLRLGVTGKADAVEFHRKTGTGKTKRVLWQPFPVEYKRGRPKKDNCDKVQLCAQAMCLEEMLDLEIPGGALFYGKTRRRQDVVFDAALRLETENAAKELHELFESRNTPKPVYEKKCETCSFVNLCLPKTIGSKRSANSYLNDIIQKS